MRTTRTGSLIAAAALASTAILSGAGIAGAQSLSAGSLFPGSGETEQEAPGVADQSEVTSEGNYTMTATAYDNCTVEFTLETLRDEGYGNWRGDFRVDGEDPYVDWEPSESTGNRGAIYRAVLGTNPETEEAIKGRDNSYTFATGEVTVDLTEERTMFDGAAPSEVVTVPGVEANEDGEHTVNFGVYQGPVAWQGGAVYNTDGEVTVTGCPTASDGGPLGSLDIFGSLEGIS